MSKKFKEHHQFELNFAVVSRVSAFLLIIYFLITIFSSSSNTPPALKSSPGESISSIVSGEIDPVDYFNNTLSPTIQSTFSGIFGYFEGFPGKQLSELRKMLIRQAADELIKSTEN